MIIKNLIPKKVYDLQKKIIKKIQDRVIESSKKQFIKYYRKHYEDVCLSIEKEVPFMGSVIAGILREYKEDILKALV